MTPFSYFISILRIHATITEFILKLLQMIATIPYYKVVLKVILKIHTEIHPQVPYCEFVLRFIQISIESYSEIHIVFALKCSAILL